MFRDRRGENRRSPLFNNQEIRDFIDGVMGENTLMEVCRLLTRNGFVLGRATVRRMSRDLGWVPTAPWYTDVLTTAQKYKRVLFCEKLLGLTPTEFLRVVMGWVSTDEKWWDITGPSRIKYTKGKTKKDRKMQNQVLYYVV
jgi:hypothetical protein